LLLAELCGETFETLERHPSTDPDLRLEPAATADSPADLGEFDPETRVNELPLDTSGSRDREPVSGAAHAPGALSLTIDWSGVATPSPIDDAPLGSEPAAAPAVPLFARASDGPRGWLALFAFLAIAAGSVAVAIVVWSTMSSRPAPAAAVASPSAVTPGPLTEPVPVPEPEPAPRQTPEPAVVAPKPPAVEASRKPPPIETMSAPVAATPQGAGELPAAARAAIDGALDSYRRSFTARDAASVAGLQGADVATLETTFAGRRYQSLTFDRCAVRLVDANAAIASCEGSVSEVLTSDPTLRRRPASWTIGLRRTAPDHWAVERVSPR
jgi:hypothetical protein